MKKGRLFERVISVITLSLVILVTGGSTSIAYALSPPTAPVITSPGSSTGPGPVIGTLTPTLKWNPVSGADYYALAISKYPYGAGNIIYNPQQVYGSSLTVPGGVLVYGEKYRWNMQAHNSAGWSAVSNTLYFQTPPPPTQPPAADFIAAPREGPAPLLVQFTDQSIGNINSWFWDFGDGGTSTDRNPTHIYTMLGTYAVSLTVVGPGGTDTEIKSNYIAVETPVIPTITRAWASKSIKGFEISVFSVSTEKIYVNYEYENPIGSVHKITWYDDVGNAIESWEHIIENVSGIGTWGLTYPGKEFWPGGCYRADLFINDILLGNASWTVEGVAYQRESVHYFKTTEGLGIKYHVTDDYQPLNCNVWAVSQYFETGKPHGLDFVFTLIKEGTTGGYFRNSCIGGEVSRIIGGKELTLFYAGFPIGNQAQFYRNFSLPRFFYLGDEWSVGDKKYNVEYVGSQMVNGIQFSDCIRITIDDSQNAHEYMRGTGYFILARDIGIVKLVFNRMSGKNVLYEYVEHDQLTRHRLSGTITRGGVPVGGIIVQIANANWGTLSVTDSNGIFSLQAYGPDVVLRIGYDKDNDGVFDFDDPSYPVEYCVNNITSDISGLIIDIPTITRIWTSESIRGSEIIHFPTGTDTVYVNYAYTNPIGSVHKIVWYDAEQSFTRKATHTMEHASGIGTWSLTNTEAFARGGSFQADLFIDDILLKSISWTVGPVKYYANAHSAHFTYGYYIELMVDDPNETIQSVNVTGPGIDGSMSLVSGIHPFYPHQWWSRPNVSLGMSPPSVPLVYTFAITEKTGSKYIVKDNVLSHVESFTTNLSPSNNEIVIGELVFSWTGIDLPGVRYKIELSDDQGNRIWDSSSNISNTYYVYDGPTLSLGGYQYYVCSWSKYGDSSLASETFRIGQVAEFETGDITKVADTGDAGLKIHKDDPTGDTVKIVPDGWTFTIIGGPQCDIQGYDWWEIREEDYESSPIEGWVAEDFLEKVFREDLVPSSPHAHFVCAQDRVEQAIEWAINRQGSTEDSGYCLRFVSRAFGLGRNINFETTKWNSPHDAKTKLGNHFYSIDECWNPPRGALIFFSAKGTYCDAPYGCIDLAEYGHIGMYVGNNEVLHTFGTVKIQSITEVEGLHGMDSKGNVFEIDSYIGWAYPPKEWLLTASIDVSETSVRSGEEVIFDGIRSCGEITSYEWNFDDGTKKQGSGKPGVETHRFRGTPDGIKQYRVTLTVEDAEGNTATDMVSVVVEPIIRSVEISGEYAIPIFGISLPFLPEFFAKMTVSYNWIGTEDGDDIFMISSIACESQGLVGVIWAQIMDMDSTPPAFIWRDIVRTGLLRIIKSYDSNNDFATTPLFGIDAEITSRTFNEGTPFEITFRGIEVSHDNVMAIWGAATAVTPPVVVDIMSRAFHPDASETVGDSRLKWLLNKLIGMLESPGVLRVYDFQDRVTGLVNGETREEIPLSIYDDENETVMIFHPADPSSYRYEVIGTEVGSYSFRLGWIKDEDITRFSASDIPLMSGAVHQYTIDWDALSQGEEGVTIQIDSDGDGTFEESISADNALTNDEFLLQTATTIDFDPDTLNLTSKGKFVTVYIELPPSYDVNDIDISSIHLNCEVSALTEPIAVGDYDNDAVLDLMVKFDRAALQQILTPGDAIEITLTGKVAGIDFEGTDTIRVIDG